MNQAICSEAQLVSKICELSFFFLCARKLYTNKEKENSRIAEYTLTEGVCTFGCIMTNRIRSDFAHFYRKIHHFIVCGLNNTTM